MNSVFSVHAQTNFYTNVTNLWYQGYKTNVLNIANERLNQNTNDIAGWMLKAEYHLTFCERSNASNAFVNVLRVGDNLTTTNFVKRWPISKQHILWTLEYYAENPITQEEIQQELPKASIKHNRLYIPLIEALQKDGYFD